MTQLASRVADVSPSATVGLADRAAALRRQGVDLVDLSAGRAADGTPSYIVDEAVAAMRRGQTHQTPAIGLPAYRAACAAKLRRENGIDADPEEIIATMGVKQGLTLALLATISPGDEVIIEDPCFVSYRPLIRIAGGVPVAVRLRRENGFRWDRSELEAYLTPKTRAILVNSPHNPTGTVYGESDIDRLADVAVARDLVVVSDEVYERLTWGNRSHLSIAGRPQMRGRTITVMGLTKAFSMGGWRIGFLHAPQLFTGAMASLQAHLITCANSFCQAGATAALGGHPKAEVLNLWSDWERRCQFVAAAMDAVPGVKCAVPQGGFYAWADISGSGWQDLDSAEALLRDARVVVVPGSAFGPSGKGYLRLSCVGTWPEVQEGVRRSRPYISCHRPPDVVPAEPPADDGGTR